MSSGSGSTAQANSAAGRVGIVLVSHSPRLAEAVAELIRLLGAEQAVVTVAGGTDDGQFGTSDRLVAEAINAADRGAGVVVIPDLGSSVLTTRRLLLDDEVELPPDVRIADTPFVEGAVAAASTAAFGAGIAAVMAAAEDARSIPKL